MVFARKKKIHRWMYPVSGALFLTGSLAGFFCGVEWKILPLAFIVGAVTPTLVEALNDVRLLQEIVRAKLAKSGGLPAGGSD